MKRPELGSLGALDGPPEASGAGAGAGAATGAGAGAGAGDAAGIEL